MAKRTLNPNQTDHPLRLRALRLALLLVFLIAATVLASAQQPPGEQTILEKPRLQKEGPILSITKKASAPEVPPGDVLAYTLVVNNSGDADATGVVITDALPANVQFARADSGGSLVGGEVQWTGKQIQADGLMEVTFEVTITSPLLDGTEIVNQDYGVTCAEGVGASGDPITVTAGFYHHYLPFLLKGFSSAPPPPICDDAIENGGFENGDANLEPWIASSASGMGLIYSDSQMPVHGGVWGAWLAGYSNAHDELCQVIEIPENCTSATAAWWWQMKTLETNPNPVDHIRLEARPEGDLAPEVLGTASNLSQANAWIPNTAKISARGTVTICFVTDTNPSLNTDFYVDDAAVEVCVPGE